QQDGAQIGGGYLGDDVVAVPVHELKAQVESHDTEHADTDDGGPVADGCGDEGRLDEVFTHGEEALGDGLVADRVGQDRGDVGSTLVQERFRGEEVRLLGCEVVRARLEHARTTGGEEDHGDDDDHCTKHRKH